MKSRLLCTATSVWFALAAIGVDAQQEPAQQGAEEDAEPDRREPSVRRLGDVMGSGDSEFSMDIPAIEVPQGPIEEQPDVTLPDPELDDRLQDLLDRRAMDPDNPDIERQLAAVLDEAGSEAYAALEAGDLERARGFSEAIAAFEPQRSVVVDVAAAVDRRAEIDDLLSRADAAVEAGNLLEPADASAWTLYQRALELDADSAAAAQGLDTVSQAVLRQVADRLAENEFDAAETLLQQAEERGFEPAAIEQGRSRIESGRQDLRQALVIETRSAIDAGRFDEAESGLNELIGLGLEPEQISLLRASLEDGVRYGGFEPGQTFQDGIAGADAFAPAMVVMPAGRFMMGSPRGEDGRVDNEGPRFRVAFERGFALSRTEVTVGQFRRFVEATGYTTDAERVGESRVYLGRSGRVAERDDVTWRDDFLGQPADDDLPVIHVSWNDADAYARWLAESTDRPYRLPTEAEFEYALRAGSQSPYWWGSGSPDDATENVTGDGDEFTNRRRWTAGFERYSDGYWGPAPVASLQANPFGLFDMGGNVMEWVADCWHDSYVRAPGDGSAWINPGCDRRVIRGASWSSTPAMSRSAFRLSSRDSSTDPRVGFRVARDL